MISMENNEDSDLFLEQEDIFLEVSLANWHENWWRILSDPVLITKPVIHPHKIENTVQENFIRLFPCSFFILGSGD